MAYKQAIEAFANSIRRCDEVFVDVKWKPFLWDLSKGLNALAQALEKDIGEIRAQLDRLEKGSGQTK